MLQISEKWLESSIKCKVTKKQRIRFLLRCEKNEKNKIKPVVLCLFTLSP